MRFKATYLGHSALYLETGGSRLVVDPYLTGNPQAALQRRDLDVDYILVTHGHSDHLGDTLPLARESGAQVIGVFELITWLENQGLTNVHAQHLGGGHRFPFGYLKLTPALHGSMMPDGACGGPAAGFLLTTRAGEKIYIAGDTGLFGDMRLIGEEGIDLAFLPIGDNYTMGPEDALRAVRLLQPEHVIPIHYQTWDLISQDAQEWRKRVEAQTPARVHVLNPGESYTLERPARGN